MVAVTAAEAQEAIAAGEKLRERFDNAAAMPPAQLEAELGSLKQVRVSHSGAGTPSSLRQGAYKQSRSAIAMAPAASS